MSKENEKSSKKRADKYEEKVTFDGTFEDMVNMSFNKDNTMKKSKYAFKDMIIGREAYFEMPAIDNYDLYWKITGINEKEGLVQLEVNEMGANDMRNIPIEYIIYLSPLSE